MDWQYWLRTRPYVLIRGGLLGLFFVLIGFLVASGGTMLDPTSAPGNHSPLAAHWPHVMVFVSYFGTFAGVVFIFFGAAILISSFFRTPEGMRQLMLRLFKRSA